MIDIRPAACDDALAISRLIHSVSHFFTAHPQGEGADAFLDSIRPAAIESYIQSNDFLYLVGWADQDLAGAIAIKDATHVYHLFVAPAYQRQGVARKLWQRASQTAIQSGNRQGFTVNSSLYAVPIYAQFGFKVSGPPVHTKGIAFVPMVLDFLKQ